MYDDLVRRLRNAAIVHAGMAALMPYSDGSATAKLFEEAADAIEELQKNLDGVSDAHNEGYDVGYWAGRRDYEPKWIPVEERLPPPHYVMLATDGEVVGTAAYQLKSGLWIGDDNFAEYNPEITHWMPLPQPPKEET